MQFLAVFNAGLAALAISAFGELAGTPEVLGTVVDTLTRKLTHGSQPPWSGNDNMRSVYSGYAVDKYCWDRDNHVPISNGAITLDDTPQKHTLQCMFEMEQCYSGSWLVLVKRSGTYVPWFEVNKDNALHAKIKSHGEGLIKDDKRLNNYCIDLTQMQFDTANGRLHPDHYASKKELMDAYGTSKFPRVLGAAGAVSTNRECKEDVVVDPPLTVAFHGYTMLLAFGVFLPGAALSSEYGGPRFRFGRDTATGFKFFKWFLVSGSVCAAVAMLLALRIYYTVGMVFNSAWYNWCLFVLTILVVINICVVVFRPRVAEQATNAKNISDGMKDFQNDPATKYLVSKNMALYETEEVFSSKRFQWELLHYGLGRASVVFGLLVNFYGAWIASYVFAGSGYAVSMYPATLILLFGVPVGLGTLRIKSFLDEAKEDEERDLMADADARGEVDGARAPPGGGKNSYRSASKKQKQKTVVKPMTPMAKKKAEEQHAAALAERERAIAEAQAATEKEEHEESGAPPQSVGASEGP